MLEELKSQKNLNKDEIDKRRAEAFEIIEDLRPTKSDTDGSINIINFIELREKDDEKMVFLDSDDQSFIRNNYGTIFVSLKNDIEKYITYDSSDEQVNAFINDLNKIKSTFKEIVSEDFNIKTLATAENVLPEDHCKNKLSEYANKRVSDIIHAHNSYCINKTRKDFASRVKSLEENIDPSDTERFKNIYGLLKEIKTGNEILNKPVNLTDKETTDNFLKTFRGISNKFEEINEKLNPEKESQEMSIDLV